MPTATNELRDLMLKWFGTIDMMPPLEFLRSHGYEDTLDGLIVAPTQAHNISEDENSCIEFLFQEWDWAF